VCAFIVHVVTKPFLLFRPTFPGFFEKEKENSRYIIMTSVEKGKIFDVRLSGMRHTLKYLLLYL